MKSSQQIFLEVLQAYCNGKGISLSSFSHGWINQLSKGDHVHVTIGHDIGLNRSTTYQIVNDKGATHDLLAAIGVPVVPTWTFINPVYRGFTPPGGNWQSMIGRFKALGHRAIVKANEGSGGEEVYLVENLESLEDRVQSLFSSNRAICMQPFIAIDNEFRAILVGGKTVLAYRKMKPAVTGNGKDPIGVLIRDQLTPAQQESLAKLPLEEAASGDINAIAGAGEIVNLSFKHNLGRGGAPHFLDEPDEARAEIALAAAAAKAVGLEFGAVDIAATRSGPLVMEINGNVTLQMAVAAHPDAMGLAHTIFGQALDLVLQRSWGTDFSE